MSKGVYILLIMFALSKTNPIVKTKNGKVEGRISSNENNKTFYVFQGIPFAKPPIEELRFEAPVEADSWEGVLNVTENNIICPQMSSVLDDLESEDCLFLNVYTPELPNFDHNVSFPVMFFIYGGGFIGGAAIENLTGPDYFMDHDVILVTVNYRVGIFGFLSTQDTIVPGNNGLKDQQLGLQWVQQNIIYFGGDPSKVTIFGISAGGASVGYHLLNLNSAGLFRGAILQSGSPLCHWAFQRNAREIAFTTGKLVDSSIDIKNTSSKKLVSILKNASLFELKLAALNTRNPYDGSNGFSYAPVIEPKNDNAFLTNNMYEILKSGKIHRVPSIIGFTDEELIGIAFGDPVVFKNWDQAQQTLVPEDMHLKDDRIHKIGKLIHEFYVQDGSFENNHAKGVKYASNNAFNRAILKHAEIQARFTEVYFYQFSYSGKLGGIMPFINGTGRVSHAADHNYLFRIKDKDLKNFPKEDILAHDRLIKLWTNFAKYLAPTPKNSTLLQNVNWTKIEDSNNIVYLNINTTLSVERNPKNEMYKFWNELYNKYGVVPFDTY